MKHTPEIYAKAFVDVWNQSTESERNELPQRFVRAIEKRGDLGRSESILRSVAQKIAQKNGGRFIKIEYAREKAVALGSKLNSMFKKEDYVETSVNPSLHAGVRITIDGTTELDMSFARKLRKLFN